MKLVRSLLVAIVALVLALGGASSSFAQKQSFPAAVEPNVPIANVVYNADFETLNGADPTKPDGWTVMSGGTSPAWGVSNDFYTGARSLYLNSAQGTYFVDVTSNSFSVAANVPLYLTYAQRLPNGGTNQIIAIVDVYSSGGALLASREMAYFVSGTAWNYGQVAYSYTPPTGASTAKVRLHIEPLGAARSFLFDSISFGPSLAKRTKTNN